MATTVVPGFQIVTIPGGGNDAGRVCWIQTGHAYLTQTGQAAVSSQIASYVAGRSSVPAGVAQQWNGMGGNYHCLNADLASQAALLATVLQTAANITGPTS